MEQELADLTAAVAVTRILRRVLESGVPSLIADDDFRQSLAKLCVKLEQRLDEESLAGRPALELVDDHPEPR